MRVFTNKLFIILSIILLSVPFIPMAHATGALSSISDTMTRVGAGATSNHTILFTTPTGIANTNTVTLTFPSSSFTMGASLTGVTIADNGGTDNAVTSATYSTNVLTITASASSIVAAGHTATIKIPSAQITNPTANTYVISVGGTFNDVGSFAVSIVSDDQIPVSATVTPTITFTVTNTTLGIGAISSSSPTYSSTNNVTIGTNAHSGYTITVKDTGNSSSPGLYDSATSTLIASGTADLSSTTGYGGQCHKSSGSGSCHANYPDTSGNSVGTFALSATTFASYGSKPSGTDTFQVRVGSKISSSQEAGSYVDTLTFIGTANF